MFIHWNRDRQRADRAEVLLHSIVSPTVQLLVSELCCTLLACLLVLLAVGLLAVHAAVLDEAAGRTVLELDGVAPVLAAVGAGSVAFTLARRRRRHAVHLGSRLKVEVLVFRRRWWKAAPCGLEYKIGGGFGR